MASERTSQRAFFGVSALLVAASAALTTVWCASMSAMGEMPLPGGWTKSMAWMRMPGQTWSGAAASFLGMWVVMRVAMMLPSLASMLWRCRQAVGRTGGTRLGRVTALVGVGYFFVRTVFGMAAFPLGVGLRSRCSSRRRRAPVHRVEGTSPCLLPGGTGARPYVAGGRRHGLATRPAPRPPLQPLLCRSDGDPPGHWGHEPSRDGGHGGSHHRRTSRTSR
jgi:predicted metal-binding integral membrane protein DUF2182